MQAQESLREARGEVLQEGLGPAEHSQRALLVVDESRMIGGVPPSILDVAEMGRGIGVELLRVLPIGRLRAWSRQALSQRGFDLVDELVPVLLGSHPHG